MDRIWTTASNGGDKIIAIDKEYFYKGNPKNTLSSDNIIDDKFIHNAEGFFRIPIVYIKSITLQENKNHIQVFFGKNSEEHIIVKDSYQRLEIFNYLKDHIPHKTYQVSVPTLWDICKKPVIAMTILLVLYLWSLVYVLQENNNDIPYANSFFENLTRGLASLGFIKLSLFFLLSLALPCIAIIIRSKKKAPIHTILIKEPEESAF